MELDLTGFNIRKTEPYYAGILGLPEDVERYVAKAQGLIGFEFFAGDKIIETSNKNDLGIMNGDIGSVVRKSKDLYIIEFDGDEVEYSFEGIQSLELAYAITVHKSQGSEYEAVIIQCSNAHWYMRKKWNDISSNMYCNIFDTICQALVMGPNIGRQI